MSYIADHANLTDEVEPSSLRSDFLSFLSSGEMTDLELISSKDVEAPSVSLPYSAPADVEAVDTGKVLAALKLEAASHPVLPSSVRVHSLILLVRLPILRERIEKALQSEKASLTLSLTPEELNALVKYVYSDSFDAPVPPTQDMATHLAKKSVDFLNLKEVETLRFSLVALWRKWLLSVVALAKEYRLNYLETLASKALGAVVNNEAAVSSFTENFKALKPISASNDGQIHELNMDAAMKAITAGFSELSHGGSSSGLLSSSHGIPAPSSATNSSNTSNTLAHTAGITSPSYAPNDIAFRVLDEPGSPLIGAHKLILCGRSKYLQNMLTGGLLESRQVIIDMADISHDTLKAIVEFCYTDDVTDLNGEMIMELLMKARLFGLDRLLGFVESIIGYSLDITNVASIANVAFLYELPRLAKATKFYILSHWSQVTKDISWTELDPRVRQKLTQTAIKWEIISAEPNTN